jgi:queuine/archaeosine tRNA-ribosyltransferase
MDRSDNDEPSLPPPTKKWKYDTAVNETDGKDDYPTDDTKIDASDSQTRKGLTTRSDDDPIKDVLIETKLNYLQLPPELTHVDFSERVSWGKFHPYNTLSIPLVPINTEPMFDVTKSPALCHHIHAVSGRARACTIHVRSQPGQSVYPSRPIPTPMFMPVGTKGCLKALTFHELVSDPALQCPIILANTYHLAIQPGTEVIDTMGGLHSFQGLHTMVATNFTSNDDATERNVLSYNLLTDSGGFQMVSLAKLSEVTEEGVMFENPYQQRPSDPVVDSDFVVASDDVKISKNVENSSNGSTKKDMLLLRPEDSIQHQNNIGANIIMALDDVISSVSVNEERFQIATYRTLRWYDRCYNAHMKKLTQNLFPIVQGGLDTSVGGLREQCLAGFRHREINANYIIPGYAIGGLAGGEEKHHFWKVVDQCCRALPDNKPRYLMGYVENSFPPPTPD